MENKNIVYVNYSPYENQGKILDFILENFERVFLFSLGHHAIGENREANKITVYHNGEVKKVLYFSQLYVPPRLVFLFLPIRSIFNAAQMIWYSFKLKRKYGSLDIYFSVNGFTAWLGLILRRLHIVEETIYWVCDYYPINHRSVVIRVMRWIYWKLEKRAAASDRLLFHNQRLVKVWKKLGVLPDRYQATLIPIATGETKASKIKKHHKVRLCFLGVLKKSQGLDYIFDSAENLYKNFPGLEVHIIGPGPDENYFKRRSKESKLKVIFHGYLGDKGVDKVIDNSTIGIATYVPDPTTVSYFGDPGKIKRYISRGLPVVATNIHEFSDEIEKENAGVLVEYGNKQELVDAIRKINSEYESMSKNAAKLSKKYYYKDVYPKMFDISK